MKSLPPHELKARLAGGGEIAFLDVREHGQYGEGHPFLAVPAPYSRLEAVVPRLVPRRETPVVLLDDGDGVAEKAAQRLAALGYSDIAILQGGATGWAAAGYTLFKGVNVPSKAFGEMVEQARHTPCITAPELKAMQDRGEAPVILDGRPVAEYSRMNIPGGVCCPNAELGHRLPALAPDERTPIVVNCAGRTRSIMGAQSLIELGVRNPVMALENGTQGWLLAGFELERGAARLYPADLPDDMRAASRAKAAAFIQAQGIPAVDAPTLQDWRTDGQRTVYLFDVRTAEEFRRNRYPGAVHAPGGQLVQATDSWVGVRNARIVLCDDTGLRAAITAHWLRQMGHDACVLDYDVTLPVADQPIEEIGLVDDVLPRIDAAALRAMLADGAVALLDLNGSADYRRRHIDGARWAIRPRLERLGLAPDRPVVLTAADWAVAELAAVDLKEMGCRSIRFLAGHEAAWTAAGLRMVATPQDPPDADCIDHLFFVHDRHAGNLDACRQYLAWETGLLDQMDEQERGVFRI
ncbi:MAG: rhodanese-like domain-containing protein [Alphaproteobacteria bacterium]|nr:rhodanese-like domain-containing protein [Alphaproteobacteria bacterium]